MDKKLLEAAHKAAATIASIYQWVDMVDAAGGTASIAGVAKVHAMIESLKKNRGRIDNLIIKPLNEAIDSAKNS